MRKSKYRSYNADIEYNRGYEGDDSAIKMIGDSHIIPDLIVHKRSRHPELGYDNLICIEMKKDYQHPDLYSDKARLAYMTHPDHGFCYKSGYMLIAKSDTLADKFGLEIESVYHNGHRVNEKAFR